jgi:hypothetical protein
MLDALGEGTTECPSAGLPAFAITPAE